MLKTRPLKKKKKIIFLDTKSYNKFYKLKSQIKKLKYNCGNQNMTHYISYNEDFFKISTEYKHQLKHNGQSEHYKEASTSSRLKEITKLIDEHVDSLKHWKFIIDCCIPNKIDSSIPEQKSTKTNSNSFIIIMNKLTKLIKKRKI